MKTRLRSWWRGVVDFHREEEGMESIEVVAIVAVAAIILIFVKTVLWPKIKNWTSSKTDELTSD